MNFYASPEYLHTLADVYFRGNQARIEDVCVGQHALRLLILNNQRVIASAPFLDYHVPLAEAHRGQMRYAVYARSVVHRIVELQELSSIALGEFEVAPYVDWTRFRTYADY